MTDVQAALTRLIRVPHINEPNLRLSVLILWLGDGLLMHRQDIAKNPYYKAAQVRHAGGR